MALVQKCLGLRRRGSKIHDNCIYFVVINLQSMIHKLKMRYVTLLAVVGIFLTSCGSVSQIIQSEDVRFWEEAILRFDSLNIAEFSDENTLLVTGSSSIRMWDSIHIELYPYRVMQRGYGGARLSDLNYYAERIIKPQQFKAILIFVANDISGGEQDRTPREVMLMFKMLVKQIRERNPDTPVCWIEITPTPRRWHASEQIRSANEKIRNFCDRKSDLFFIETYDLFVDPEGLPDPVHFRSDRLHLNSEGYKRWAKRIKQALENAEILP